MAHVVAITITVTIYIIIVIVSDSQEISKALTLSMSTSSARVCGASWKVEVAWHMGDPWGLKGGAFLSTDQLKLMAADESSSRAARAFWAGGVSLHNRSES